MSSFVKGFVLSFSACLRLIGFFLGLTPIFLFYIFIVYLLSLIFK